MYMYSFTILATPTPAFIPTPTFWGCVGRVNSYSYFYRYPTSNSLGNMHYSQLKELWIQILAHNIIIAMIILSQSSWKWYSPIIIFIFYLPNVFILAIQIIELHNHAWCWG